MSGQTNFREIDALFEEAWTYSKYHLKSKKFSTKLISALNEIYNIPETKLEQVKDLITHWFTIMIMLDNIVDNSILRYSKPTAHLIYGVPQIMRVLQFYIGLINQKLCQLHDLTMFDAFIIAALKTWAGQGIEMSYQHLFQCPTETEYLEVSKLKAGGLFYMVCPLFNSLSTAGIDKIDNKQFCNKLGLFVQLIGDYIIFLPNKYSKRRIWAEDISTGTFTLPSIYAIHNHPNGNEILDILKKKTDNYEEKQHCVNLLIKYGAFEYTEKMLKTIAQEVVQEIPHKQNSALDQFLTFYLKNPNEFQF